MGHRLGLCESESLVIGICRAGFAGVGSWQLAVGSIAISRNSHKFRYPKTLRVGGRLRRSFQRTVFSWQHCDFEEFSQIPLP